ncbi:MAG TPA: ParB/RepB/Spo0J family partition protein [Chitinophagaceae bacterium]|nr:ParB/RepB/Spo0J family partition protein [Chitinophagaceae bacterium]
MTSNPNKKEALGKGIRSLLQHIDEDLRTTGQALEERAAPVTGSERIALDLIEANPRQPRHDFDPEALRELSESIRAHDLIQPLTVVRSGPGKYRLIAGERRLRAARMAGLRDVPVYIRQGDDQKALVWALLENLQRQDLNAIEVALGYQRLMEEGGLTQEQVAGQMGKDRSTVTNYIRLLKLPPDIQVALRTGKIAMGHARVISGLELVDAQLLLLSEILKRNLSVRQTELLARATRKPAPKPAASSSLPPAYRQFEDRLSSHFSTKVRLTRSAAGKGNILIEFYSDPDLGRIYDLLLP